MFVEIKLNEKGFKAEPTEATPPENPNLELAVASLTEGAPDPVKDQERREAFLAWCIQNPREVDRMLDDLHRYGALFEWEYCEKQA